MKREANILSDLTAVHNGDLDRGRNCGTEEWRSRLQINYYFSQWLTEGWNSLHGCKGNRQGQSTEEKKLNKKDMEIGRHGEGEKKGKGKEEAI